MVRQICERDTDRLFVSALARPSFAAVFVGNICPHRAPVVAAVHQQTRHSGHSGTIDIELVLSDGLRLLVENKIDAAYSINSAGLPQPERYAGTIASLRAQGVEAQSVLLAPEVYLRTSRQSGSFDHVLSYESLRAALTGNELLLLDAAIEQALAPYEPQPNVRSAAFFQAYSDFCATRFPQLQLKRNPNGNGVRPTESRTIYFDVARTLTQWPGIARPRMSLQCRDGSAPSASVKIMLGGLGAAAGSLIPPKRLSQAGGYLRPAGRSLGCVIDTPRLDTQQPFSSQEAAVERGSQAAAILREWWNGSEHEIRLLCGIQGS